MLKADSSALKSDSDVQSSAAPPMIPSVAALSWTLWTRSMIRSIGVPGSACLISWTRKLDSSARPVSPRSASARNVSGTNDSSAKYAIIAARCGPRSAKNFCTSVRLRTRTGGVCRYCSAPMDAQQALADLTEISSQIQAAVLFDEAAEVQASTLSDDERARELARAAAQLLAAAEDVRAGAEERLTQLEAATRDGSVFVVRDEGRTIAATTAPEPTVGLVFYDLKSCLRQLTEQPEEKPKRKPRRKKEEAEGDA